MCVMVNEAGERKQEKGNGRRRRPRRRPKRKNMNEKGAKERGIGKEIDEKGTKGR